MHLIFQQKKKLKKTTRKIHKPILEKRNQNVHKSRSAIYFLMSTFLSYFFRFCFVRLCFVCLLFFFYVKSQKLLDSLDRKSTEQFKAHNLSVVVIEIVVIVLSIHGKLIGVNVFSHRLYDVLIKKIILELCWKLLIDTLQYTYKLFFFSSSFALFFV